MQNLALLLATALALAGSFYHCLRLDAWLACAIEVSLLPNVEVVIQLFTFLEVLKVAEVIFLMSRHEFSFGSVFRSQIS